MRDIYFTKSSSILNNLNQGNPADPTDRGEKERKEDVNIDF